MCSLFGIIDYRSVLSTRAKNRILSVLSRECEIRGTDATGIAYNDRGGIRVYKRPVAARRMRFRIPYGVNVIMGHTRMATQGSAKLNYNNHPWAVRNFALAHNGVLWNDKFLRETEELPYTLIETDSYIAVQLLEQQRALNFQTIGAMAEKVQGSFVFTILDRKNSIYFVRGENPLSIFCYDGFYLYASTDEILRRTEFILDLRHQDSITTKEGDILKIERNGQCSWGNFRPSGIWGSRRFGHSWYWDAVEADHSSGIDYLTDSAKAMGISPDDVQLLLDYGCNYDEIEELLYEPQLLCSITSELRCGTDGKGVGLWV